MLHVTYRMLKIERIEIQVIKHMKQNQGVSSQECKPEENQPPLIALPPSSEAVLG